jgi:hypothetical protein
MRFIMKVRMPNETANDQVSDPQFGKKMHDLLDEIKAEAAYFTTFNGARGAYIVVNMTETSQMPKLAEPFFLWLRADVDWFPVMTPEDLGKAGPDIAAATKKWG